MLLLFIGLLFAHCHFTINGFDLLPDFLGYILVFIGLGQLKTHSPSYEKARPRALVLAAVNFILLFPIPFSALVYALVALAYALVQTYLLYLICSGVKELEAFYHRDLGGEKLHKVWLVIAISLLAAQVISLLSILMPGLALLTLPLALVCLVAVIVMLVYLYRCHKALQ